MGWFSFNLTSTEKDRFSDFQKFRQPSMKLIGRGTLTISVEDARNIRKQKNLDTKSKTPDQELSPLTSS